MANSRNFQEMWQVSLTRRTQPGDSGAWVLDAVTGDIYGHIVATDPVTGLAFIIPAYKIFNEIKRRYDTESLLPTYSSFYVAGDTPPSVAASIQSTTPGNISGSQLQQSIPESPSHPNKSAEEKCFTSRNTDITALENKDISNENENTSVIPLTRQSGRRRNRHIRYAEENYSTPTRASEMISEDDEATSWVPSTPQSERERKRSRPYADEQTK